MASVTYDLGALTTIDAVALWNEDGAGISTPDLFGSTDGVSFFALSLGLAPVDYFDSADYGAQTFGFGTTSLRFVRFDA